MVIDAGGELTLQAAGNFVKIDAGGIISSKMINFGTGAPSSGGGEGQLPDVVKILGTSIPQSSLPDIPFIPEKICISCLIKAEEYGEILVKRENNVWYLELCIFILFLKNILNIVMRIQLYFFLSQHDKVERVC
nr:hypothetical protein [Providencia stuartii]